MLKEVRGGQAHCSWRAALALAPACAVEPSPPAASLLPAGGLWPSPSIHPNDVRQPGDGAGGPAHEGPTQRLGGCACRGACRGACSSCVACPLAPGALRPVIRHTVKPTSPPPAPAQVKDPTFSRLLKPDANSMAGALQVRGRVRPALATCVPLLPEMVFPPRERLTLRGNVSRFLSSTSLRNAPHTLLVIAHTLTQVWVCAWPTCAQAV